MEDLRRCSKGHALEPHAQCCNFGHETCISLKCQTKECTFRTKPANKEFKDLLQSEIDEHISACHTDVKEAMRNVCCYGHAIGVQGGKCEAGHTQGISLRCQIENCSFATKPVTKSCLKFAKMRLEKHTSASHPSHKDGTKSNEIDHVAVGKNEDKDKVKMKDVNEDPSETNKKLEKRTCPLCFKLFYSIGNMRAHVKSHHDGKGRFHCQMCEKTFSSKISLQYHEKCSHSNGGQIACENCDEKFSNFDSYSSHRKSHRSIYFQLAHKCEVCGKIIQGEHNLNRHLKEIHALETTYNVNKVTVKIYPHKCDQCDAAFKRKSHLNSHVQGKHGEERYPCSQCGKDFKNKSNLNRHVKNIHK